MKFPTGNTLVSMALAMTAILASSNAIADPPVCGDKRLHPASEQCDDGNTSNGDGCSSTCMVEGAICGNASVEKGEACDDANTVAGDGCSPTCLLEATPPELVIITESSAPLLVVEPNFTYESSSKIRAEAPVIENEPKYEMNSVAEYSYPLPYCGDGIKQAERGEQCDDGNKVDNDQCDSKCRMRLVPLLPSYLRDLKVH